MDTPHLTFLKVVMIIASTWPLTNPKYSITTKIYKIYRVFFQGYYILFVITLLIAYKDLLDESQMKKSQHLGYILLYIFICWKTTLAQTKPIQELLQTVLEKRKLESTEQLRIFKLNSFYNFKIDKHISFVTFIAIVAFWISAFTVYVSGKKTGELQVFEWFPFDVCKYYNVAFTYQMIAATMAAWFYFSGDCFYISLILYAVGRLKLLRNSFKGIGKGKYEIAKLVRDHYEIIEFVKKLDKALNLYLFGDFIVRSYYITLILYQLMNIKISFAASFSVMHLLLLLSQMLYIYFHANQLQVESMDVSLGIMKSNWFDLDISVQKSLLIILMRLKRPLQIHIGPLYDISNDVVIKTLKAAYTYVMFNLNQNKR